MKPIIALTGAIDDECRLSLLHAYTDAIERSGGVPLVVPYTKSLGDIVSLCDGIVLTGGADIDPSLYGERASEKCGRAEPQRDELELSLIRLALEAKKPILAICRGAQLVNVALGGTLYQDISSELDTKLPHRQSEGIREFSHSVKIEKDTPLCELIGRAEMRANSFHHQAIKQLGKGLAPMAYSPDGIIEALYLTDYPYLRAYQWHPERLIDIDEDNLAIFKDFMDASGGQNAI